MTCVTLDGPDRVGNLRKWRGLIREFSLSAGHFELHCWEDEGDAIALALKYGTEEKRDWLHGRVFSGAVTPAFVQMLLTRPLPAEEERLTPFFSLFLRRGLSGEYCFSSEHYGTEINIIQKEDSP